MSISLQKSPPVELKAPRLTVGLGWDTSSASGGADFDLDLSALLLDENGKLISDHHFIFYNNTHSPDGSVEHSGDNRTGVGRGDDEYLRLDLNKTESTVNEILIIVTIHNGIEKGQNFGQIPNSYIHVTDTFHNEFFRFRLDNEIPDEIAVEFCRVVKENGKWQFHPTGKSIRAGLKEYLSEFRK